MTAITITQSASQFIQRLSVQFRVIGALMMREATAKYGHENLGFFWVMGEPLLLTGGVMIMWTVAGMEKSSVGVVPMALTGYCMITLWRHVTGQASQVMRRTAGLRYHRNIKMLDIMVARGLLETLAILTAFFVAYIPIALFGFIPMMRDPTAVIYAFLLQGWFAWSFSLPLSALTEVWEPGEKFVGPFLYITLPFTGVFTMQAWMPQSAREAMAWSPLVSNVEQLRSGIFSTDIPTYYYPLYSVMVCVIQTAFGFYCVSRVEKHIVSQ